MTRMGAVYLVGAGPGDPGLLTVRGRELLERADVVAYDHLVPAQLLSACRPEARLVYVGKEADHHTASQRQINALLVRTAKAGKTAVRLKGGDPMVFGRGGEEALVLAKARVPFEIVPGVTSATAVPAYAGIPVTQRGIASSVAIVTAHEDPTKPESALRWQQLATGCDTLVFLMGVSTLPQTAAQLMKHGRSPRTPAAVIEWGTTARQRTVTATLATIAQRARKASLRPPAVLVVGDVVALRPSLNWFETKPLFGRRILVTRPSDRAPAMSRHLEALGAEVEELPAISLEPVKQNGAFHAAVRELPATDWVFFTSPEGLAWFSRLLKPMKRDLRSLKDCHIGAIGPKTAAAVEAKGLHVDFVPSTFSQEGMVSSLPRAILHGKRAVIFSAEGARSVLEEGLRRRGVRVRQIAMYRAAVPPRLASGLEAAMTRPIDLVTVTSASCVDHVHQTLVAIKRAEAFRRWHFASIGPVTSKAVRALGGRVAVEARVSTMEGLVDAIARWGRR